MKILVTGAGALLGQGIIRAIKVSSLIPKPTIIAVDPSNLASGLYWAAKAYLVPMALDSNYIDEIKSLLAKEKPDIFFIGTDVELPILAKHRFELEKEFKVKIIVSNSNTIEIADDKWLTFKFLKENNFDYPESVLPEDTKGLKSIIDKLGFPLIVKPRIGARSVGVHLVNSQSELQNCISQSNGDLIVQECVGNCNSEYTSGVLCFNGECLASITMRRDLRDGNTYRAFALPDFEHRSTLHKIAEKLNPYGPSNFQFRISKNGVPKIFEINSRFSGTTPLRALSGFNEVEMVIRYVLSGEAIKQPIIKPKIILKHWSETVLEQASLI